MRVCRMSVGTAFVLSGLLYCGCSDGASAPATQPAASTGKPVTNGQASATVPPATSPAQTAPGATPPKVGAADAPKTDAKELVAQFKELQTKQIQPRSQQDLPAALQHFAKVIDLSDKVLSANPEPADRDQVRDAALQAIGITSQFNPRARELLAKIDKLAEATLADASEGPIAASALFWRAATHLNLERDGSENDPEINKRFFALAKEFSSKFPSDPRAGQLLYMIGENAMMDGQTETATEVLKHLTEIAGASQFGQMAAGKLALLEAVGKPPEIAGPTLAGSEINIAEFKGKVVLVDFWATWCGPCVAELPNVKKVYEKYHDEGFEVLAVSFDQTKDALTRFVEDRKLPWPQIFFDEDGKRFWQNPLGQRYGINSIPATFLVDREGNLQKIGVRGEGLEAAVVEMLKGTATPLN